MNNLKAIIIVGLIIALPFVGRATDERETKSVKGKAGQSDEKKQADQKAGKTIDTSPVTISMDKPVYKPPLRGSPAGRVGGGTRGVTERESFSLLVLAPDHVGLTTYDQPNLYWYISKPIPYSVEFTITERKAVKPLFVKILKNPDRGGIQAISLADYGIRLYRDVQYKWFVTLVTDADRRSKDILAGGIIQLVSIPQSLPARLKAAGNRAPYIYAEEGLWYDAIGAITDMIDASPDDTNLRKQRASLLEQVGLDEVAQFENKNSL